MSLLETDIRGRMATVTLTDPERRNAVSLAMADALSATFEHLRRADIGAVIITGAPPAFSAGADLADLEQASEDRLHRIYEGFLAVARFPLLTIAAVNGPAVGAGLNLALACDLRVAARSALFDCRFLQLALHPGGGHTWMLRRLLGSQGATAMLLCGETLGGEEAARRGLAWSCVDDDGLLDEAVRLAAASAAVPRETVEIFKRTLRDMVAVKDHDDAVRREMGLQLESTRSDEFRDRLESLKRRISRSI